MTAFRPILDDPEGDPAGPSPQDFGTVSTRPLETSPMRTPFVWVVAPLIPFGMALTSHAGATDDLLHRAKGRRAVEVAIWGMPLVAMHAVREGYRRDLGARDNDIVYFSKVPDWRFQTT